MYESFESYLRNLNEILPELVSDQDLVKVGIFSSLSVPAYMRAQGTAPPYITITKSCFRYLRSDIIIWLRSKYVNNQKTSAQEDSI